MDFPDDDNGAILRCLQDHRFNFDVDHPVDFFALLPSEEAAEAVAQIFRDQQSTDKTITDIEVRTALDGKQLELVITKVMRVTHEGVTQFENSLEKLCKKQKGTTDGWGVLQDDDEEE
jgi:hypothetical protein